MKYFVFVIILAIALPVCAGEKDPAACNIAETNLKLSAVYNKVLAEYSADTVFIKKLNASQQAWLAYRDAQIKALFPHTERGYYGSVYPMCDCNISTELTEARIKELQQWLKGTEEGDVCAGSIRHNR